MLGTVDTLESDHTERQTVFAGKLELAVPLTVDGAQSMMR